MTVSVSACPLPILAIVGNNDEPLANGSILTQVGSVNYPTWQDAAGTIPLQNPIPLNSRGEVSDSSGNSQQLFLQNGVVYVFTYFDGPNGTGNQIGEPQYVTGAGPTPASVGAALYPIIAAEGSSVVNIQYPYGDIRRYGADPANADNQTFIQNAYNTGFTVTGPFELFLIASPVVANTDEQNTQGYFQLKAALTWTPGTQTPNPNNNQNSVNNFLLTLAGARQSINAYCAPFLDGNYTQSGSGASTVGTCLADGLQCSGGGESLNGVTSIHNPNIGIALISASGGDSNNQNCFVTQWNNGDQPFLNQANLTAAGVYYNRADCYTGGITTRWCKYPFRFGPLATTSWLRDSHPYNGGSQIAAARIDPTIIRVDEGSSSTNIHSSYLDDGHIDFYSSDVHLINGMPLQGPTHSVFTQEAGQVAPNFIRAYATGKGYPYDLDIKLATAYLASNNNPSSALPTAFIGFYPGNLLPIVSLVSAAGTATLTYTATSSNPPAVGASLFLNGVTASGFNASTAATATANSGIYQILTVGSTDFTKIGAAINAVDHVFYATGAGSGTGTAALAYTVLTASQTAGGAGVGVVTITFTCATTGTGTGGTIQWSWSGNMNGFDSASGLLPNNAHQQANMAAGRYFCANSSGGTPADVLHYTAPFVNQIVQSGNQQPSTYGWGNQAGGQPFGSLTTGFFAIKAAPAAGAYTPAAPGRANLSLNLNGTAIWDDGSTNGMLQLATQATARFNLDGFSSGVQSLYPATDNYMNVGYVSPSNKRVATVYCVNAVSVTSDARDKTDLEPITLGLNFIELLEPVSGKWKVGGTHIEHGKYVYADTGEDAPADYNPAANFEAQENLLNQMAFYPGPRKWMEAKGDMPGYWGGRTEQQEQEYTALEMQLLAMRRQYLSITRTPEIETDIPGKRTHYWGATAQNVKAALDTLGIKDHAGYLLSDPIDSDSTAHLRPDEIFIPALIKAVKELSAKVAALEAKA